MISQKSEKRARKRRRQQRVRHLVFEKSEPRLMLNADWHNPFESRDVNADAQVSPLDALAVINSLNIDGARRLGTATSKDLFFDVSNDGFASPIDALLVINHLNTMGTSEVEGVLSESKDSIDSISVLPIDDLGDLNRLSFRVEHHFSTPLSQALVDDTFSVYVVSEGDPSRTLLHRSEPGDSVFALHSTGFEIVAGISSWDDQYLTIDLSRLDPAEEPALLFQFVNGDSHVRSLVRTSEFTFDSLGNADQGSLLAPERTEQSGGPVQVDSLSATSDVKLVIENESYDSNSDKYYADLSLFNSGVGTGREVVVTFDGIPEGASLTNASGFTPSGLPYINFEYAISSGGLQSLTGSNSVSIEIDNPGGDFLKVSTAVLGGVNKAPKLAPLSPVVVSPGASEKVQLQATDDDGDDLQFTLQTPNTEPPSGYLNGSGELLLKPTPDDVGSYEFVVTVSDGAATASQTLRVDVVEDPVTSTRVSGKILDTSEQPLSGLQVEIGNVVTTTDNNGGFVLDLGSGPLFSDTLRIRGDLASGSGPYPFIAEKLPYMFGRDVISGVNNVIDRPIYLPVLDIANAVQIDPTSRTIVDTDAIPSATVTVEAGNLVNQQGLPFEGRVSITEVPIDRTPAALPPNLIPDMVVTIQPGEMRFNQPAPLTLPNRGGHEPGTAMALWSIDPTTGEFQQVGDGEVSGDGERIETTVDGIRNSSWHFFAPEPEEMVTPAFKLQNQKQSCGICEETRNWNSEVELHSGALRETHDLVGYSSLGQNRSYTLHYNSQRANPRPIITFGADNVVDQDNRYLAARLSFRSGSFEKQVPGFSGSGLSGGGFHFWDIPTGGGDIEAAIQGDLSDLPSGVYEYSLDQGFLTKSEETFAGALTGSTGELVSVNASKSPFGAGWEIGGVQRIIQVPSGRLLLIDGDGSNLIFEPPVEAGESFVSPPGDFTSLVRNSDSSFTRTTKHQTVFRYSADGFLNSITDRNGNRTEYVYTNSLLSAIIDPVGLKTQFSYENGRIVSIVDPGGRTTRFAHDGTGNLIRITEPDGTSREFSYDSSRHLIQETDKRGNIERTKYGFHGRAIKAVRKDGTQLALSPLQVLALQPAGLTSNPSTAPIAKLVADTLAANSVSASGDVKLSQLDQQGQNSRSRDSLGPLGEVVRDEQNLVVRSVDPRGFSTFYEHDESGNITRIEDDLIRSIRLDAEFLPEETFFTSQSIQTVHLVDLNGDQLPEAVVAPQTGSQLEIYRNFNGNFSPQFVIDTSRSANVLASGDFNADGFVDIVYASTSRSALTIHLGDSGGEFGIEALIDVDAAIRSIDESDFNQDGFSDLLIRTVDGVLIAYGSAVGLSAELVLDVTPQPAVTDLSIADMNGDNFPDLVLAHESADKVSILFNEGSGFQAPLEIGGIASPSLIHPLDLDDNGSIDLAVFDDSSDELSVYLATVDATFGDPIRTSTFGTVHHLSSGDFDGDGKIEIVFSRDGANLGVSPRYSVILTGLEEDELLPIGQFDEAAPVFQSLLSDLNNDGIDDVLTHSKRDYFSVRRGGLGRLSPITSINLNGRLEYFVSSDLNSDGFEDLITRTYNSTDIEVHLHSGTNGFLAPVSYTLGQRMGGGLGGGGLNVIPFLLRDITGNDSLDLVATNGRSISVLLGDSGTFDAPIQFETARSVDLLAIGRINADSNLDIALLLDDGLVQTFIGDGEGGFASLELKQLETNFSFFQSLAIADGAPGESGQVLVGLSNPNEIRVFAADVDGRLADPSSVELSFVPSRLIAEELNPDNRIDVLVGGIQPVSLIQGDDRQFSVEGLGISLERSGLIDFEFEDINGDGFKDVAALGSINSLGDLLFTTWLGSSTGSLSEPRYFELGFQSSSITQFELADIDNDDAMDIVINRVVDNRFSEIDLIAIRGLQPPSLAISPLRFSYDQEFSVLTSQIDELGRQTKFEIDSRNGNVLSTHRIIGEPDVISNGESDDLVTVYVYNSQGLVASMTDPMGRRTEYGYTANGLLESATFAVGLPEEATRRFEYDAVGNQTASIDELGNRTEYEYDSMNRVVLIREADPDKGGPLTSPVSTFSYDANGNIIQSVDAVGTVNSSEHDSMNRLIASTDHLGNESTYEYGPDGNLISITDPLGLVSRNKYDARDRLVESIDPEGGRVEYSYDLSDNLMSLVDPVDNQTTFSYDSRDRLIREIDPLGNSTFYEYDLVDNLVEKRDRNNRLTKYSYDDIHRVVSEHWIASDDSTVDNTINFSYDKSSNLVEIADDFSRLTFGYDARDRVVSADNSGTPRVPDVIHRYSYDGASNVLAVTDAIVGSERGITDYEYDALNRMVSVKQSGSDVSEKAVDFVYNQIEHFSEILRYSDSSRDSLVARTGYRYDSIDRLVDLKHIDATENDLSFFNYSYDSSSRIASITDKSGETRYRYDGFGQIVLADRAPTDQRGNEFYSYDANGNRVGSHLHGDNYDTDAINRLRDDGVYTYEYDVEGNLLRRLNLETRVNQIFDWDHRNRLIRLTDTNDGGSILQIVDFSYDALDRRIAKSVYDDGLSSTPAVITSFVYDGQNVALQFVDADGSDPTQQPRLEKRNLHGPAVDQFLAEESAQGVSWALHDHLGSVSTVITNDGVIIEDLAYDSFGNSSITTSGYGFTGREIDIETGIYYYRARYYDSSTGRFLSEDPIGFAASDANLYRYVFNNPISHTDPSGEIVPILAWGAAIFIGGFGVGAGIDASIQYYDKGCVDARQVVKAGLLSGALDVVTLGAFKHLKLAQYLGRLGSRFRNSAIGFAPGTAADAVRNVGRIDHAGRHLADSGIITGNQGSKAFREAVRFNAIRILENPSKTFDHVIGGQRVKGFYGTIDDKQVVFFVAKEPNGKIGIGELVTAVTPSPQQIRNWGL